MHNITDSAGITPPTPPSNPKTQSIELQSLSSLATYEKNLNQPSSNQISTSTKASWLSKMFPSLTIPLNKFCGSTKTTTQPQSLSAAPTNKKNQVRTLDDYNKLSKEEQATLDPLVLRTLEKMDKAQKNPTTTTPTSNVSQKTNPSSIQANSEDLSGISKWKADIKENQNMSNVPRQVNTAPYSKHPSVLPNQPESKLQSSDPYRNVVDKTANNVAVNFIIESIVLDI